MNRLLSVIVLSTIYCLSACSEKAADESVTSIEEHDDVSAKNSNNEPVEINSLPEKLSEEQRDAFELRAIQKFEDFVGYVKIISDQKVDKNLIAHTMQQATELFVSDTTTIQDSLINNGNAVQMNTYLQSLKKSKKPQNIIIDNSCFSSHLSEESFKGTIEVYLTIKNKKIVKYVDVFLVEVNKNFGGQNEETIEIKLGNIY